MDYQIKALNMETWSDFEVLAEKHNGVWGGCWCTWFHQSEQCVRGDAETNKALKKRLVEVGKTHAALVYDQDKVIAWCQYGTPEELPAIYHKKQVEALPMQKPDWRITCIFVDSQYRKKGVAKQALLGALNLIKKHGGGIIESYPQDTKEKKISSSFLYNGTVTLFNECGFEFVSGKGKNHAIMRKQI